VETSVYTRPLQLQGESLGSSTPGAQDHIAGLHASVCGCSSDQAARSFVPSEFLFNAWRRRRAWERKMAGALLVARSGAARGRAQTRPCSTA
jgi:hypothetical protein